MCTPLSVPQLKWFFPHLHCMNSMCFYSLHIAPFAHADSVHSEFSDVSLLLIHVAFSYGSFFLLQPEKREHSALFILTAKINYHCSKNMKFFVLVAVALVCIFSRTWFWHTIRSWLPVTSPNQMNSNFPKVFWYCALKKSINGEYYVQLIHELKDMQKHATLTLTRYSAQCIHKHTHTDQQRRMRF